MTLKRKEISNFLYFVDKQFPHRYTYNKVADHCVNYWDLESKNIYLNDLADMLVLHNANEAYKLDRLERAMLGYILEELHYEFLANMLDGSLDRYFKAKEVDYLYSLFFKHRAEISEIDKRIDKAIFQAGTLPEYQRKIFLNTSEKDWYSRACREMYQGV